MTTAFRMAFHSVDGRRCVEVFDGGIFIAGIYPTHDARTFRVVSKYRIATTERADAEPVNAVDVKIGDVP